MNEKVGSSNELHNLFFETEYAGLMKIQDSPAELNYG
jgi:hypothetical protein